MRQGGEAVEVDAWLTKFVRDHRALSGIVFERGDSDNLLMIAACNVPSLVVASARVVYRGQGLAGTAFERNAALSTCTGRSRENRFTPPSPLPQECAVALPIPDKNGEVRALVYLVFPESKRLRDDELVLMLDRAATLKLGGSSLPQTWPPHSELPLDPFAA
jgi:L-methionine (R)-S-oxide reductase